MSRERPSRPTTILKVNAFPGSVEPTLCVKVSSDRWCFHTHGFTWAWEERHNGPNLGMYQANFDYTFQLYTKTIEDAVCYAWGFTTGWNVSRRLHEESLKTQTPTTVKE